MEITQIKSELIVTKHIKDTMYTWTLSSRMGDMLDKAETFFGTRDHSFTLLGIEFARGGQTELPYIRHNGGYENKQIIVWLNTNALTDATLAYFQLAHEVVHLIAPPACKQSAGANNLEEGIATWFQLYYLDKVMGTPYPIFNISTSYRTAYDHVAPILDTNPYAFKDLRGTRLFNDIIESELLDAFPQMTEVEVSFLLSPFIR